MVPLLRSIDGSLQRMISGDEAWRMQYIQTAGWSQAKVAAASTMLQKFLDKQEKQFADTINVKIGADIKTLSHWIATRNFQFTPPRDAMRTARWRWALLQTWVLRRDCVSTLAVTLDDGAGRGGLRMAKYYQVIHKKLAPLKSPNGETISSSPPPGPHPGPSATCRTWDQAFQELVVYQKRLDEHLRTEWEEPKRAEEIRIAELKAAITALGGPQFTSGLSKGGPSTSSATHSSGGRRSTVGGGGSLQEDDEAEEYAEEDLKHMFDQLSAKRQMERIGGAYRSTRDTSQLIERSAAVLVEDVERASTDPMQPSYSLSPVRGLGTHPARPSTPARTGQQLQPTSPVRGTTPLLTSPSPMVGSPARDYVKADMSHERHRHEFSRLIAHKRRDVAAEYSERVRQGLFFEENFEQVPSSFTTSTQRVAEETGRPPVVLKQPVATVTSPTAGVRLRPGTPVTKLHAIVSPADKDSFRSSSVRQASAAGKGKASQWRLASAGIERGSPSTIRAMPPPAGCYLIADYSFMKLRWISDMMRTAPRNMKDLQRIPADRNAVVVAAQSASPSEPRAVEEKKGTAIILEQLLRFTDLKQVQARGKSYVFKEGISNVEMRSSSKLAEHERRERELAQLNAGKGKPKVRTLPLQLLEDHRGEKFHRPDLIARFENLSSGPGGGSSPSGGSNNSGVTSSFLVDMTLQLLCWPDGTPRQPGSLQQAMMTLSGASRKDNEAILGGGNVAVAPLSMLFGDLSTIIGCDGLKLSNNQLTSVGMLQLRWDVMEPRSSFYDVELLWWLRFGRDVCYHRLQWIDLSENALTEIPTELFVSSSWAPTAGGKDRAVRISPDALGMSMLPGDASMSATAAAPTSPWVFPHLRCLYLHGNRITSFAGLENVAEELDRRRRKRMEARSVGRPQVGRFQSLPHNTSNTSTTTSNAATASSNEKVEDTTIPLTHFTLYGNPVEAINKQEYKRTLHRLLPKLTFLDFVRVGPDSAATM